MTRYLQRLKKRVKFHTVKQIEVLKLSDYMKSPISQSGRAKPYQLHGKVERSHREDQKHFYSRRSFFSLTDFEKQLASHNRRSNNLPMRPLN